MQDNILAKVQILLQQGKVVEAEKILKDLLSEDPNNVGFLMLLAEVSLQQDKYGDADSYINIAIQLAPDDPDLFYVKSRIALDQSKYDKAESNLKEAIALDPSVAAYFALLAHIKLVRKQYEEALSLADKSLELDAENLLGLNTRSSALLKLNQGEESFQTIEGALREDPNNPYTHANYGWGLLEQGDHKKALIHFKEALKNDPNYEYAKAGMAEALKASNPAYRLFLKYAFWMSNMTSRYQWGVILGFYFGVRLLNRIAQSNEALQPFLMPIIILLSLIAFSTWVISPISNLFLRLNHYGNFLLDEKEKMSSNFVAVSFFSFLIGLLLFAILGDDRFLTIAVFGFAMMLPLGVMFSPSKYKHSLLIYTAVMGLIGIVSIITTFSTGVLFNNLSLIFLVGFIAFQWIANFLLINEDNP